MKMHCVKRKALLALVSAVATRHALAAITLSGDTNLPDCSTFALGQNVSLNFVASGLSANQATQLNLTYQDQFGNTISSQTIPVTANSSGNWSTSGIAAPASTLGYYRVNATLSAGSTQLASLGSRRAGFISYAVVPDPASRQNFGESRSRFGLQGGYGGTTDTTIKRALGVRWVLDGYFGWSSREPSYAGQWNGSYTPSPGSSWQTYALPSLYHEPSWAAVSGTLIYNTGALTASAESAWANYCTKAATAFAQKYPNRSSNLYQITWEPIRSWGYLGTDEQLLKVYQIAYAAIHAADPKAVVAGPTMGLYDGYAAGATFASGITNETQSVTLMQKGLGQYIDAFTIHPYYPGDFPGTVQGATAEARGQIDRIRYIKSAILQYTGKNLPIYGTEQGVVDGATNTGELNAARAQIRQNLILLGEGLQYNFSFYAHDWLKDGSLDTKGFYYNLVSGIPYSPAKVGPKPIVPAYAAMTSMLDGFDSTQAIEDLGGNKWGYKFFRNADARTVQAFFNFSGTAESASIWTGLDRVRAYDMMGNSQWLTTSNGTLSFSVSQDVIYLVTPPVWKSSTAGDWNKAGNWTTLVPNGVDTEAHFTNTNSAAQSVYTNVPVTVGALSFDSLNQFVLGGAGSVTLQVSAGSGSIDVLRGSHKVNIPLVFASNSTITVAAGASLKLSNPVTIKANRTVTQTGNLAIEAPLVIEPGGVLAIVGASPVVVAAGLSVAAGARIDLLDNSLIFDPQGNGASLSFIQAQVRRGYASGDWTGDGITSSVAANVAGSSSVVDTAVGTADNRELGLFAFGEQEISSSAILLRYVYCGDSNLDGEVSSVDFAFLASHFGSDSPTWMHGDYNYDGRIDASDLQYLRNNFGQIMSTSLPGNLVPEPSSLAALFVGCSAFGWRRFHRTSRLRSIRADHVHH
jgi:hypothetical protein